MSWYVVVVYKLDGLIHRFRRTQHCCQRLSSWHAAFITHTRRIHPNPEFGPPCHRPFDYRLGATLLRCSLYFPEPDIWFEPAFTECLRVPEFAGQNPPYAFLHRPSATCLSWKEPTHNDGPRGYTHYSALHLALDANRMDIFSKMLLHPAIRSKHFDFNVEMQRLELEGVVRTGQDYGKDIVGWTCN